MVLRPAHPGKPLCRPLTPGPGGTEEPAVSLAPAALLWPREGPREAPEVLGSLLRGLGVRGDGDQMGPSDGEDFFG